MALKLKMVRRLSMIALIGAQFLPSPTIARATELAGAITEIDVREGQAESEARPAGPLLSLNAGDTVRVSRDASVVVLLTGGRGSVKVDATNSPFEIPAPTVAQTKLSRGWILLEESVKALLKLSQDSAATTLGSRGHTSPLVVLTPHNGVVLPDSLVFEWVGGQLSRYTIRIVGPSGLVLERNDFAGLKTVYPANAAPLIPGVRYQLQVTSGAEPSAKAWFEVADPARAETVRQDISELVAAAGSTVSPNTLVATQVAYLASQGLLLDARLMLMAALADQPDDPTFHFLLGNLYERLGLPEQAAESFAQALVLGRSRPQQ